MHPALENLQDLILESLFEEIERDIEQQPQAPVRPKPKLRPKADRDD